MEDKALLRQITLSLGAVVQSDLHLDRTGRRLVQRLVAAGRLVRHPRGVVALPGADRLVVTARIHRGVITCCHGAHHYRLPVPPRPGPAHLLVPQGAPGLQVWGEHCHRVRDLPRLPPEAYPVAALARCLADLLCCSCEWTALVAVDAALHSRAVTAEQIADHLAGTRRALGRERLAKASAAARSPLETLARLQLRDAGLHVRDGVGVPGVGEVDLVVNDWLVVELDGYEFHSDLWAFQEDRRRDRELVRQGYTAVRFVANNVRSGRIVEEVRRIVAARPAPGRAAPR